MPHSRFETLPRAAHFPHLEDPEGLARVLLDFIDSTDPARIEDADWCGIIEPRAPRGRQSAAA